MNSEFNGGLVVTFAPDCEFDAEVRATSTPNSDYLLEVVARSLQYSQFAASC